MRTRLEEAKKRMDEAYEHATLMMAEAAQLKQQLAELRKKNWQKIGEALEGLCEAGLFPAIGYDVNGWEAWVFNDNPIEGQSEGQTKVFAKTAAEAMEKLLTKLREKEEINKDSKKSTLGELLEEAIQLHIESSRRKAK